MSRRKNGRGRDGKSRGPKIGPPSNHGRKTPYKPPPIPRLRE